MTHAANLARGEQEPRRWLVDGLWSRGGVGLLAGPAKSCKSWLGLDLALSVASATPCLGHFHVEQEFPVMLYLAEDAQYIVRQRLHGLCRHRRLDLEALQVHFLTEPQIRLDRDGDHQRLAETVSLYAPHLLVLDPLVRMHAADENDAGAVSGLLARLRTLQRQYDVAILLVHHTRKSGASAAQIGLSLRGSGDFHAWGDHNLYLRRRRASLELRLEHRAAASPAEPHQLALVGSQDEAHLELQQMDNRDEGSTREPQAQSSPEARVLTALDQQGEPVSLRELRTQTRMRTQTLCQVLTTLTETGRVLRSKAGYCLVETNQDTLPLAVSADH
ncbi:AAA family ATPase [Myxococcota bacterium]